MAWRPQWTPHCRMPAATPTGEHDGLAQVPQTVFEDQDRSIRSSARNHHVTRRRTRHVGGFQTPSVRWNGSDSNRWYQGKCTVSLLESPILRKVGRLRPCPGLDDEITVVRCRTAVVSLHGSAHHGGSPRREAAPPQLLRKRLTSFRTSHMVGLRPAANRERRGSMPAHSPGRTAARRLQRPVRRR